MRLMNIPKCVPGHTHLVDVAVLQYRRDELVKLFERENDMCKLPEAALRLLFDDPFGARP